MLILFLLFFFMKRRFNFRITGSEYSFTQKLDHFNMSNEETFNQRYYINDTFFTNRKTMFLYIGGEGELFSDSAELTSIIDVVKKSGSLLVSLEHRYFGHSYKNSTEPNYYKYLTVNQALEDLAVFTTSMKKKYGITRVISVGGSYPGTLSAYFRLKYPHICDFAWASSAPLLYTFNFTQYDDFVGDYLRDKGCYQNTINSIKSFTANTSDDYLTAAYLVSSLIQYDTVYNLIDKFCTNATNYTLYDIYEKLYGSNTSNNDTSYDEYTWGWMVCNEFGWFQIRGSRGILPQEINYSYFRQSCKDTYSIDIGDDNSEFVEYKNHEFGGLYPNVTNILFTIGVDDPWSSISTLNEEDRDRDLYVFKIQNSSHCSCMSLESGNHSDSLNNERRKILSILLSVAISNEEINIYRYFSYLVIILPFITLFSICITSWFIMTNQRYMQIDSFTSLFLSSIYSKQLST